MHHIDGAAANPPSLAINSAMPTSGAARFIIARPTLPISAAMIGAWTIASATLTAATDGRSSDRE